MFQAKSLYALALLAALFLGSHQARSETATNLKCDGCVGSNDLKDSAVTSRKIRNKEVKPADLANKAKPGGAAFSELNAVVELEYEPKILRRIKLVVPANGIVIVNASGNVYFPSMDPETVYCNISLNPDSPIEYLTEIITAQTGSFDENRDTPIALSRAFKVKKGKVKIYFLCREVGANKAVQFYDPVLVGVYVPGGLGTALSESAGSELGGGRK